MQFHQLFETWMHVIYSPMLPNFNGCYIISAMCLNFNPYDIIIINDLKLQCMIYFQQWFKTLLRVILFHQSFQILTHVIIWDFDAYDTISPAISNYNAFHVIKPMISTYDACGILTNFSSSNACEIIPKIIWNSN